MYNRPVALIVVAVTSFFSILNSHAANDSKSAAVAGSTLCDRYRGFLEKEFKGDKSAFLLKYQLVHNNLIKQCPTSELVKWFKITDFEYKKVTRTYMQMCLGELKCKEISNATLLAFKSSNIIVSEGQDRDDDRYTTASAARAAPPESAELVFCCRIGKGEHCEGTLDTCGAGDRLHAFRKKVGNGIRNIAENDSELINTATEYCRTKKDPNYCYIDSGKPFINFNTPANNGTVPTYRAR